jgi:hypothetical protein
VKNIPEERGRKPQEKRQSLRERIERDRRRRRRRRGRRRRRRVLNVSIPT